MESPGTGSAGGSARQEYERRRANDHERIRSRWGRFGGIAVALSDERQSTKAWSVGAGGEEIVGARLDGIVSDRVKVLHDRRIPGSKANIDHIVVTPAGVWVIDTKRYRGRPELKVEGGILRARIESLRVGGRDQTKLVDGMHRQVEMVQKAAVEVPVSGVLCFVDADWPLFGGPFMVQGVHVLWPRKLTDQLVNDVGDIDVRMVTDALAASFPSAT
ncbi:nuclease-related domain-containing protein [Agromyces sp. Marseille-Q5079]|uniref:nuclease-related domain-containing protein n=1 Tax=Agromyces sp. Marseille-Q5079 TaxID=3439059 RepID=UPI003D9CB875